MIWSRLHTAAIVLYAISDPEVLIQIVLLISQSQRLPWSAQDDSYHPSVLCRNLRPWQVVKSYGPKPIWAFKVFNFSPTNSNSSQKHPFNTISRLSSFCLTPLPMISWLQWSKNVSDSQSQIMYIVSSLLIFLNIPIVHNTVTRALYRKTPNDLEVFIWFPKGTALPLWG